MKKKNSPKKKAKKGNKQQTSFVAKKKTLVEVKQLVQVAVAEQTTLDTVYIVDDSNNQVKLEVKIGDVGQTSNMTIFLDSKSLAHNIRGDFAETEIGSNSVINGKKLSIVANIADTSQDTNLTSLTIKLKEGTISQDFPLMKTVKENGDSVDYICLIEFFNPTL